MSYQRYMCIGNLTDDPKMTYINEVAKTTFAIAVNYRKGKEEATLFVDVECWAKLAETVAEYMRKGRKVVAEGRIQEDRWEDPDGTKRRKWYMRADDVRFLDSRPETTESRKEPRNSSDNSDYPF